MGFRSLKVLSLIWRLLWKTAVVAIAVVLGALGASGVGFHGAELIAKLPFIKILLGFVGLSLGDEDVIGNFLAAAFGAGVKFSVSAALCLVPSFLVYRGNEIESDADFKMRHYRTSGHG